MANTMPKQTSAEFIVANEELFYIKLFIKNFEYTLFRILSCFLRSLRVVLCLKSPFLIWVSNVIKECSVSINVK